MDQLKALLEKKQKPMKEIPIGKGRKIRDGKDIAFLTLGPLGNVVVEACNKLESENINAAHYDMRFAKPLDEKLLHMICKTFDKVISVEDETIVGGFGSAILEFMNENNYKNKFIRLGIPDNFIEHGSQEELYKECGLDVDGIVKEVEKLLQ